MSDLFSEAGDIFEQLLKHNPNHDALGRFASAPGGAGRFNPPPPPGPRNADDRSVPHTAPAGSLNDDDRSVSHHDRIIARPASHYPPANSEGVDTEQQFKHAYGVDALGKKGAYTAERQELHQAVIGKLAAGVTKSDDPTIYMTGGGPASGKSTLMEQGHFKAPKNALHVDADEMKKSLPEYRQMTAAKSTAAAAYAHEESSYLSKVAIKHATDNKLDAIYDSTGDSSYKSLADKVESYRAAGHKVVAHYVTVDTNTAVGRSNARAAKTGRMVPESVVRATHASVSAVLPKAMENGLFDEVTLWDTNQSGARKVASAKGKNVTIHDQTLWTAFLAKANE